MWKGLKFWAGFTPVDFPVELKRENLRDSPWHYFSVWRGITLFSGQAGHSAPLWHSALDDWHSWATSSHYSRNVFQLVPLILRTLKLAKYSKSKDTLNITAILIIDFTFYCRLWLLALYPIFLLVENVPMVQQMRGTPLTLPWRTVKPNRDFNPSKFDACNLPYNVVFCFHILQWRYDKEMLHLENIIVIILANFFWSFLL